MKNYFELNARELIKLIQTKQITVVEMIKSHLDRIDSLESKVHAWAYLDKNYTLEQAKEIDRQIAAGTFKGTLFGLPVGLKDVFNTFDMPTAMGSPQWKGFTPGNDARVVHYLRMAGAIFPGKTVTAEFAVHAPGETVNPNNPEYSPGTSSSGSAAAVAAKMIPVSVGTQTAGSIVRPASYCGVYGFKPSFALLPRTGVLKTTDSLDTLGMFARTSADLKLLFEIMRVHGDNFPISNKHLNDPMRQDKGNRPWKIALIPSFTKTLSQPYSLDAFDNLVKEMSGKEVQFVTKELPKEFQEAHDIHELIYQKSLSYYFQKEFSNTKFISEIIYHMISEGKKISREQYEAALEKQKKLYASLDQYFSDCDAIMTLSTQGIAPKLGGDDKKDTCLIWTMCGAPAISIPAFKGPDNMPFGLQIVARRYNDYLLLDLAKHIEGFLNKGKTQSAELSYGKSA